MATRIGYCPDCGGQIPVREDGIVVTHKDPGYGGLRNGCPGSGQPEAPTGIWCGEDQSHLSHGDCEGVC